MAACLRMVTIRRTMRFPARLPHGPATVSKARHSSNFCAALWPSALARARLSAPKGSCSARSHLCTLGTLAFPSKVHAWSKVCNSVLPAIVAALTTSATAGAVLAGGVIGGGSTVRIVLAEAAAKKAMPEMAQLVQKSGGVAEEGGELAREEETPKELRSGMKLKLCWDAVSPDAWLLTLAALASAASAYVGVQISVRRFVPFRALAICGCPARAQIHFGTTYRR
eukprot:SAG11_NODE_983_length_6306_cov_19.831319_7_plen_225_part_00